MALDKKVVTGLLEKMGVADAGRFPAERAQKKLTRRLESNGAPADLTAEEKEVVVGLGFALDAKGTAPAPATPAPADKPAPAAKASKKAAAKEAAAAPAEEKDEDVKPAPTAPAAKAPAKVAKKTTKAKAEPKAGSKVRGSGTLDAFKAVFKTRKTYERGELIAAVIAATGCDKGTPANYISLAKKGKIEGFKLTEEKKGDKKILTKAV